MSRRVDKILLPKKQAQVSRALREAVVGALLFFAGWVLGTAGGVW